MNLMRKLRKSSYVKVTVFVSYIVLILQPLFSNLAFAGNGPLQPDFQGPAMDSNEQLVDPFTGDFQYAIDVLSEAGIPMNLNYSAGVSMEQDASWVGLGWNLNPGSIVRNVRGLPDDFKGDEISEDNNLKANITGGISVEIGPNEAFGFDAEFEASALPSSTVGLDFHYNTYSKFGISSFINTGKSLGEAFSIGFNINSGSESSFGGVGISPSFNLKLIENSSSNDENVIKKKVYGMNLSANLTTNEGLKGFNVGSFYNNSKFSPSQNGMKENSFGASGSTNLVSFQKSYTPTIGKEFISQSYSFRGTLGAEATFLDVGTQITGYYTSSTLKNKFTTSPAYGYLYLKNDSGNDYITDVNRENDVPTSPASPTLPIGYYTYDTYNVTAPGIGGTFRGYRNDIGYLQDDIKKNNSVSVEGGVEIAGGTVFKGGLNIEAVIGSSIAKPFVDKNSLIEGASHLQTSNYANIPENNVYFKYIGENYTETEQSFVENFKSNFAVESDMRSSFFNPRINSKDLIYFDHNYYPEEISDDGTFASDAFSSENNIRNGRISNSKSIQYYTKEQVDKYLGGEEKYQINAESKDQHIQRIVITAEDGTKYVFGLPAYNHDQQEISFSVGGATSPTTDEDEYLAKYDSENERTPDNKSGNDHFYKNVHTPAYAYTYLLTEILSPDFVDVKSDGPSDDDLGTYVLYTYGIEDEVSGKYEPNMPEFKWRTPNSIATEYGAYVKGMTNNSTDDRVNILYGVKEIWYLSKVETKTHIAEFLISDRDDGYTTAGIDGGISTSSTQCLKKLNEIKIYSKFDVIRNEFEPDPELDELVILDEVDYKPIKTIYFDYNYELFPGIPNNDTDPFGRLTLVKVSFKYFNSNKSLYNYYSFEYNVGSYPDDIDPVYEPEYHPLASDRWGTVQEYNENLPSQVFPYTRQDDQALSDYYAGLWNIKKISLPDGGYIEIDYEADDYAYVQNKRAGQMFTIKEAFYSVEEYVDYIKESDFNYAGNDLYTSGIPEDEDGTSFYFLSFKLETPISDDGSQSDADSKFKKLYLIDYQNMQTVGENLFFRFYINTDGFDEGVDEGVDNEKAKRYEYVQGYGSLDYTACGVAKEEGADADDDYTIGFIKLNPVEYLTKGGDFIASLFKPEDYSESFYSHEEINPITKATWQYTMLNSPEHLTDDDTGPDESMGAEEYIFDLLGKILMFETALTMFMNPNQLMYLGSNHYIGKEFEPSLSAIRLHNPDGFKIGGGYRVKEIRYGDDWADMTEEAIDATEEPSAESGSIYGIMYNYVNPVDIYKSSGVAAYEPLAGGEENPFRYPDTYTHYPGNYAYEYYKEHPFGESFFPSPTVGYSYVEEIPFGQFGESDDKYTDIGKTVYSFYTAKDYPTIVRNTELNPINKHFDPSILTAFFASTSTELYAASQGFVIETNDMHGKPKSNSVLSKEGNIISSVTYNYYELDNGSLTNVVKLMDDKGVVDFGSMGVTYDIFEDHRYSKTQSGGGGVKIGLDYTPPIPVVSLYPHVVATSSKTALSVITKHVSRSGILKEVVRNTNGSIVTSSNLVFDRKTGAPIITSEQNEFNDTYYVVSIPAHWVYEGMGFANENWAFRFIHNPFIGTPDVINIAESKLKTGISEYLVPGDMVSLAIYHGGGDPELITAWVYEKVTEAGIKTEYFIDVYGQPINFGAVEKVEGTVLLSGRKNFQNTPVMSVICRDYPILADEEEIERLTLNADMGIIDASVTEFSDIWRIFCTDDVLAVTTCECDDYLTPSAEDLFNFLEQLCMEDNFYHTSGLEVFNSSPIAVYNHGFSFGLANNFIIDDHELNTVDWSTSIVGVTNVLLCNFALEYDPQQTDKCEFNLDFGAVDIDAALFEDIFSDPDELEIEFIVPEEDDVECEGINSFTMVFHFITDEEGPGTISATCTDFNCFNLRNCKNYSTLPDFCMGGEGDYINPYLIGLKGNWKPKISYKYLTDRTPTPFFTGVTPSGDVTDIRNNGTYEDFSSFWQLNGINEWEANTTDWTWSVKNNQFDPLAHTAETENALGILGSATYNLNHVATEMVANNAGYWQIAFENYEDDIFLDTYQPSECHAKHFDIAPDEDGEISRRYAHSGNFSMRLISGGYADYTHTLTTIEGTRSIYETPPMVIDADDCMPEFAPALTEEGAEYLLTFWYKDPFDKTTYEGSMLSVEVKLDIQDLIDGDILIGDEIDGWRRVECKFILPETIDEMDANQFKIKISNTDVSSPGNSLYIDDVKVLPIKAQANCYVYDFISQRLMAELDDNHYTTFYEYDDEGNLLRIKKETERGVFTIQDARYNIQKRDNE